MISPLPPLYLDQAGSQGSVSPECIAMIKGLLNPDPSLRLTCDQIMARPWFKDSLPPGAEVMNTMLLEDPTCPLLGAVQVAAFQAIVKKASVDDGSCEAGPLNTSLATPVPYARNMLQPLVLHQASPVTDSATTSKDSHPMSGNNTPGVMGGSGPSMLGQRLDMLENQGSLMPLESMSGLSEALMRMPTGLLLNAAVEDMKTESPQKLELKHFPSLVAPRSPSSLEKALLSSPNFMKEMQEFGPAAAIRQTSLVLGIAPGSSLVTRLASLNATDLAAIMATIEGGAGGPLSTILADTKTVVAEASNPKAKGSAPKGKRRVRDRSRFGNEMDHTAPQTAGAQGMDILPDDVAAATEAVMAALKEIGELGAPAPAPSIQFPWIEGPETLPLASISAMDASFDWEGVQREMSIAPGAGGGLMESPWAKMCGSAASQQQIKRLKQ